jgi:hypothetical protein
MHKTHTQVEKATHENFRYEFFFWRMAIRRLYTLAPYGYSRINDYNTELIFAIMQNTTIYYCIRMQFQIFFFIFLFAIIL